MTDTNSLVDENLKPNRESLRILAEYLERSLDTGASIVMMRNTDGVCTVYLGDPSGEREDLRQIASIDLSLGTEILELTASGANQLAIGEQSYRFIRSFTTIDGSAAIVFSMD